jgi:hypothetical protein
VNIATSKPQHDKDSVVTINSSDFEIGLHKVTVNKNTTYYVTQKEVAKYFKSNNDFLIKRMFICEADGKEKRFKTSDEFLAYMLAGGYKLVGQNKNDYSFKLK